MFVVSTAQHALVVSYDFSKIYRQKKHGTPFFDGFWGYISGEPHMYATI